MSDLQMQTDQLFTITPMKITDIKFSDGDEFLVFDVMENVTGIELAHLLQLFTVASIQVASPSYTYDYPEFIKRKGLMRHFRKEPK